VQPGDLPFTPTRRYLDEFLFTRTRGKLLPTSCRRSAPSEATALAWHEAGFDSATPLTPVTSYRVLRPPSGRCDVSIDPAVAGITPADPFGNNRSAAPKNPE
jgi:hypothetical protein